MDWVKLAKGIKSFSYFVKEIYPLSFDKYITAPHLEEWANYIQDNKRLTLLAPRGHLKSSIMYAYVMWRILRSAGLKEDWLYISLNFSMAQYHIKNIKERIRNNPYFKQLKNFTDAEHVINVGWGDKPNFELNAGGMLTFKRGFHGNVIIDDCLADPSNELNNAVIDKITRLFFTEITYIPNPDQCLYIVGTPQASEDLFFQIRTKNPEYKWLKYQAIINDAEKKTLWPQRYPYEMLDQMRKAHPREFSKEMMVEPVKSANSFLDREKLLKVVKPYKQLNISKELYNIYKDKIIFGGLDIGKKAHPSYLALFQINKYQNRADMIWFKWFDNVDYIKQIEYIKQINEYIPIDRLYYDDTRGEFEIYKENGKLPNYMKPVRFNVRTKSSMASVLEELVNTERISILNDQRTITEMLKVDNELNAIETSTGHADSFWAICLAIKDLENSKGSAVIFDNRSVLL